ncbi:hypothetical protein GCM10025863_05580 [Microbacterium suwonense]|uniref:Sporulation transcription regulator WhiA N-terminal domain-containing protein n=1 Tax=Microbacterium suwonense TaxID=683047 RepID=A0ABM8FQK9_9MICO|nr:hypothetical protein GCM10025863_05580 [Microbacterium suwonense]
MALTTDVKAELVSFRSAPPTVRVAEVTTILRFAGGLHSIAGRVAVEAEVDAETLARRVSRDLSEIYGVRPEIAQVKSSSAQAGSAGDGARWAVRVIGAGRPSRARPDSWTHVADRCAVCPIV